MAGFVSTALVRVPWLVLAAAIVSTCAVSCSAGGPKKKVCYPVKGQLFAKNEPAAGALIILQPDGGSPEEWTSGFPRAHVANDGSFDVETYGEKDGAPAGDYKVLVSWTSADPQNEEATGPDRLGGRYSDPSTSQLRAKVETGVVQQGPVVRPENTER